MSACPIEIVCGVDSNYAPHLGALLASIALTNSGDSIRVHILHDGVDAILRERVNACAPNIDIKWYEIVSCQALEFQPILHITRATYLRLIIAEVLPQNINRVIYLDVDVIVNGNLRPLWEMDIGDYLCAAVPDPGVVIDAFATLHTLPLPGRYFNAGVILFDLGKVREESILQRAIELLAKSSTRYEFADQDVLNIVLWNKWLVIDPTWNFQRKFLYDSFVAWHELSPAKSHAPMIIHFTERQKPWKKSEWHPYAWLYVRSLMRTSFKLEVLRKGDIGLLTCVKWWLRSIIKRPAIFR